MWGATMILSLIGLFYCLMSGLCATIGIYILAQNRPFCCGAFWLIMALQGFAGALTYNLNIDFFHYSVFLTFLYCPLFYLSIKVQFWETYRIGLLQSVHLVIPSIILGLKLADMVSWTFVGISIAVTGFPYLLLSVYELKKYQTITDETRSSGLPDAVKWTKYLLNIAAFVAIVQTLRIVFGVNSAAGLYIGLLFHASFCAFLILLIYNAIRGHSTGKPIDQIEEQLADEIVADTSSVVAIKVDHHQHYLDALDRLMIDEELYLNPELTLQDVAKFLKCSPRKISNIIKEHYGINFPEYINRYRVKEVINRFDEEQYDEFSTLQIAIDSGFNSKSTFNLVFKKITGKTPSAYRAGMTTDQKVVIIPTKSAV